MEATDIIDRIENAKDYLVHFYYNQREAIDNWHALNKKVFGYLCSYVPEELLLAADILPIRILGHLNTLRKADSHFQPFVCRLIRSCFDLAICGDLDHLDGVVVPYTCDGMRMLYDVWDLHIPRHFTCLLDLPSSMDRDINKKYFYKAQEEFRTIIENYIGHRIKDHNLAESVRVYNRFRKLMKELYRLRSHNNLPISSADFLRIYLGALTSPKSDFAKALSNLLVLLDEWVKSCNRNLDQHQARLHVSGSIVVDASFYELIDSLNGVVVSDDLCIGTRYFWDLTDESKDPFEAICERYYSRVPCPSKYPASTRPSFLLERIEESGAKGVIFILEKYCDPHLFDYPRLKEKMESKGLATLWLETELSASGKEQLRTRLETFIDVVKRRK